MVSLERWEDRSFHVVPCPFRVDLPLDMSGCIAAALHDSMRAGHRRVPGGMILATDRNPTASGAARARREGAIFIEVEESDDPTVAWIGGDLLIRPLPAVATPLRAEVVELLRWSEELGHEVDGFYVGFVAGEGPRAFRPARLLAALDGGVVETFEVRSSKRSMIHHAL